MDPRQERAERLPALYRSILDVVADLERRGDRALAARARRDAVRLYCTWDERAERGLVRLEAELRRALARPPGSRRTLFARRALPPGVAKPGTVGERIQERAATT